MSNRRKVKRKSLFAAFNFKHKTKTEAKKETVNDQQQSHFQVVSGTRRRNRRRRIVFYCITVAVLATLLVAHLLLPTGLLEGIQNGYSVLGSGEMPLTFYSANPTDFQKFGNVSCILNDTFFEIYNEKGKLIQAVSHGLSNPQLEVSEARFLLFDRDRYTIKIFKYATELHTHEFKHTVISADIGRNGTIATQSGKKIC